MCVKCLMFGAKSNNPPITHTLHSCTIELYIKSLKKGQNCGFDPSLRTFYQELISDSSCITTYESWVELLGILSNFDNFTGSKIGYAHESRCLQIPNQPMQARLAHPSQ